MGEGNRRTTSLKNLYGCLDPIRLLLCELLHRSFHLLLPVEIQQVEAALKVVPMGEKVCRSALDILDIAGQGMSARAIARLLRRISTWPG